MNPRMVARRAMLLTLVFDVVMAGAAMFLASLLVWWSVEPQPSFNLQSALLATGCFLLCVITGFLLLGIHKQVWRHLGWPDVVRIFQAVCLSTLLYLPVMLLLADILEQAWRTLSVAVVLWVTALLAGRMVALSRSTQAPLQIFGPGNRNAQPVLLVGDAESCSEVLQRIQNSQMGIKIRVLGIVETHAFNPGRAIRGVTILGTMQELGDIIELLSVRYKQTPWVAVTGPARQRETMMQVLDVASRHGAAVMALSRDEAAQKLEPVRPADLLARPERQLDLTPVKNIFEGANVLVTGGGGTIGSELARQAAQFAPKSLTILDASEYNLYNIDMDLAQMLPRSRFTSRIGDVRDTNRVRDVFTRAKPDIVIHAAALKHVPLMEKNLCEAVLTNVGGAINSAQAAAAAGAKRFVFISTDKAVDPDNVMGATKRLAEIALARIARESGMATAMVRFGNVLGSSGSVVPLFERQIAAGGPVTLTDPSVTRYFMTVEEASSLVLQAAASQVETGLSDLFVLDMGEPIRILQLAETMIRLKGLVPGADIEIVTTGLRDGEKMHEVLTYEHEQLSPTAIDGVLRVNNKHDESELFEKRLAELIEAAQRRDRVETLRLLNILVPEYAKEQAERARLRSA